MNKGELKMIHSGILSDKETGRSYVLVRFERTVEEKAKKVVIGEGGPREVKRVRNDEIEIKIPDGEVILNKGFDDDEVQELSAYLKENGKDIRDKAKAISSIKHILGG